MMVWRRQRMVLTFFRGKGRYDEPPLDRRTGDYLKKVGKVDASTKTEPPPATKG